MQIPDEYVLPCDFVVGHMRFRKGVKLETVRKAAERWQTVACDSFFGLPDPEMVKRLNALMPKSDGVSFTNGDGAQK